MAFGKRSVISDNLNDYSIMLCGSSGIGKTTVISEMCEKEFGADGYLLLNTGDEDGVSAIEGVTYEDVATFKKFDEVAKDIIKNKNTDYPDLKVIIIDTLDQLIAATERYAIDTWNKENAANPKFRKAKSLNSVEGGFGAGYDLVFNLIYDRVRELKKIGVATYYVCHSKSKDIVDPLSSTAYTVLTSNMAQRYFNDFKTKVHVVGVCCIDRDIEEVDTGRKDIKNNAITVKRVADEKRKIVFRDDNFSVDSKSRFAGIVDEIPLDSDELVKALKDAIQNSKNGKSTVELKSASKKSSSNPKPVKEIDDNIDDVIEDIVEEVDDVTDSDYPDNLADVIREQFKACTDAAKKKEIKTIIAEYGKLVDVDNDGLMKIYDILN